VTAVKARAVPSGVTLVAWTRNGLSLILVMEASSGFSRYRYRAVRSSAARKMPCSVQATGLGSVARSPVSTRISPSASPSPSTGTTTNSMGRLVMLSAKVERNATWLPSGDHMGLRSGPGCVARARISPVLASTRLMSAVHHEFRPGSR
jgi:hypothetical protein